MIIKSKTTNGTERRFVIGLMFYREASRAVFWRVDNARWYDSSLGRFTQADSIIPAGIHPHFMAAGGLDRYAYVNNAPVNLTDPSGHMVSDGLNGEGGGCDRQCWDERNSSSTPQEILVCGYDAGSTCQNTSQYGGQQPLSPYDNIVPNQPALWIGVDNCKNGDEKYCAAMKIFNEVANNPGSYHLVGHSAGGSAVIWAVRMLQDAGYGNRITSITLLDPARDPRTTFRTDNNGGSITVNLQEMANEIVQNGNNVFLGDNLQDEYDDITGATRVEYSPAIEFGEGSIPNGHFMLAISNEVFDKAAGYWEWQK